MDRQTGETLNTPYIQLAPMEGVLDWTLRELLGEVGGLDRMVTEFVRVTDRVLPAHVFYKYSPELEFNGGFTRTGVPVFVQLLGGEPGPMAENAGRVAELGAPGIDLNFGCPAKTVNRHDGGAVLLRDPERVFHVTRAVREAVPAHTPVSVKVRLGCEHKDFHREIAQAAEEAGGERLVVHARTKVEMYTPPAHWEYIRSMRENRKIPIVANGDIWNLDDYLACREKAGVADVALGRGLVGRPTLAHEIRGRKCEFEPLEFLRRFVQGSQAARGPSYALVRLKQMLRYWSRSSEVFQNAFQRVKMWNDLSEWDSFLLESERCQPMSKFTPPPIAPTASAPSSF